MSGGHGHGHGHGGATKMEAPKLTHHEVAPLPGNKGAITQEVMLGIHVANAEPFVKLAHNLQVSIAQRNANVPPHASADQQPLPLSRFVRYDGVKALLDLAENATGTLSNNDQEVMNHMDSTALWYSTQAETNFAALDTSPANTDLGNLTAGERKTNRIAKIDELYDELGARLVTANSHNDDLGAARFRAERQILDNYKQQLNGRYKPNGREVNNFFQSYRAERNAPRSQRGAQANMTSQLRGEMQAAEAYQNVETQALKVLMMEKAEYRGAVQFGADQVELDQSIKHVLENPGPEAIAAVNQEAQSRTAETNRLMEIERDLKITRSELAKNNSSMVNANAIASTAKYATKMLGYGIKKRRYNKARNMSQAKVNKLSPDARLRRIIRMNEGRNLEKPKSTQERYNEAVEAYYTERDKAIMNDPALNEFQKEDARIRSGVEEADELRALTNQFANRSWVARGRNVLLNNKKLGPVLIVGGVATLLMTGGSAALIPAIATGAKAAGALYASAKIDKHTRGKIKHDADWKQETEANLLKASREQREQGGQHLSLTEIHNQLRKEYNTAVAGELMKRAIAPMTGGLMMTWAFGVNPGAQLPLGHAGYNLHVTNPFSGFSGGGFGDILHQATDSPESARALSYRMGIN